MKMNIFKAVVVSLLILSSIRCQKNEKRLEELNKPSNNERHGFVNDCRLTVYEYYDGIGDVRNTDRISFKDGRVDEWDSFYGYAYKMFYDRKGKMESSQVYDGNDLLYIIRFIYKNDKVVREKWYDAVTNELADDVYYTFNKHGDMMRGESFLNNYYTTYTYTNAGNLASWEIFSGGLPQSKAEYTYKTPYNNPFLTLNGMTYCFSYTNSNFGIGFGKKWYSSEKVTLFDENGAPYIYYDLNPGKTTWQIGDQNNPIFADYTDNLSGIHITNAFAYENCKSCQSLLTGSSNRQIKGNPKNRMKEIKGIFIRTANAPARN